MTKVSRLVTTRDIVKRFVPKYARGISLDIGAGTAKYRIIIEKYVESYLLCDIDPSNKSVHFVTDALKLAVRDRSINTILCFQLLEHVPDPNKLIVEIYRSLQSNGIVILTVPFLVPYHADPGDYHRFTTQGLKVLFEDNGFSVVKVDSYGGVLTVIAEMLKFTFINPYKKNHRAKWKIIIIQNLITLLYHLDSKYPGAIKRIYANSYIVARKVQ